MIWVPKGKKPNKLGFNVKRIPKNAYRRNSRNGGARKGFQQRRNTSHEQAQFHNQQLRGNL